MFKVFEMVDKSTGNVTRLCQNFSKRYRVAVVPYKNGTYAHISDEFKHSSISMPLEMFTSIVKDSGELITRGQMISNINNNTGRKRGLDVLEKENEPPAKRQKIDNLAIKLVKKENGWVRVPTSTHTQTSTYQPSVKYQPTSTQQQATTYQPTSSYQATSTYQPTSTQQQSSTYQPTSSYQVTSTYQPTSTQQQATTYQPTSSTPTTHRPIVGWKKIPEDIPEEITSHYPTAVTHQTNAFQTVTLPNRVEVLAPPKQQTLLQHLQLQPEQPMNLCDDDDDAWYQKYM